MAPSCKLVVAFAMIIINLTAVTQQVRGSIVATFSNTSYNVNEGETVTLMIILNETATADVTFDVATNDSRAVAPGDYDALNTTVTISRGRSEVVIEIPIIADNVTEDAESFSVLLSNPSDGVTFANSVAIINITDHDDAQVVFSPSEYTVMENIGRAFITIELLTSTERQLEYFLNVSSGTALVGFDGPDLDVRSFFDTRVIISAGSSAGLKRPLIHVDIVNNSIFEPTEYFTVSLNPNPAQRLSTVQGRDVANITILDNDAIIFGFSRTQYNISEGASTVDVTVALMNGELGNDTIVTVNLMTVDVTAVASGESDYQAESLDLTFSREIRRQTVVINIIDDNFLENSEHFNCNLTLINISDPSIQLRPSLATVTITDNDNVIIGFDENLYKVNESEPAVSVDVLLNGIVRREVTVVLSLMDRTAQGVDDYVSFGEKELTFDADVTLITVPINITDNVEFEEDEQFIVVLSTADPSVILSPAQSTVTILDNDVVMFSFRQQEYTFSESVGEAEVCIDKNGTTGLVLYVNVSGTVQANIVDKTLAFSPNECSICFNVNITDDSVALETREVFKLDLTQPENPLLRVINNSTTLIIMDDDDVVIGFHPTEYNVSEGAGAVTLMIERRGAIARLIIAALSIVANTSSDNIIIERAQEIIIPPSLDEYFVLEINVSIADDTVVESTEQVKLLLNASQERVLVGAEASVARINILNDDRYLFDVGFEMSEYTTSEDTGSFTLFIEVSGNGTNPFNITVRTVNGTALAGKDFELTSTKLLVSPNDTLIPVIVIILNNNDLLNFKDFSLILSTDENSARITTDSTIIYIFDDDFPSPNVEVTARPTTILDGHPTTFTCVVASSFTDNITVHWLDENGEVVNNRWYTLPEFSIEERREVDQADNTSRVVSVLNITSLSVTTHVRGGFSCVGSIGNPILERVVTRNVMNLRVQLHSPTVFIAAAPSDVILGKNISVTCASSNAYGNETDSIAVTTHIVWQVTYTSNGEIVNDTFEATNVLNNNSLMNTFSSELFYSPLLVALNFTCMSYISFASERVSNSELAEQTRAILPQEPDLNVSVALDPSTVADIPPYNDYSITCNASVPNDLLPLQLSFTVQRVNESDTVARSSNYSTIEDCDATTTMTRLCTFKAIDTVNAPLSRSEESRVIICSVELFSSGKITPSQMERVFTLTRRESESPITVNVPSLPVKVVNPHTEALSHNLAIVRWTVPRIAYTPETYYVEYRAINDSGRIEMSSSTNGSKDLEAVDVEYARVLESLESGTTYVANIVSNNEFGRRVSDDVQFTTNFIDIFPVMSESASAAPLGAPVVIVFNISSEDSNPINESTQLAFVPLFHSPLTQPSSISYDSASNTVMVVYNHAAPSLNGSYVLCRELLINSSNDIRELLSERLQLCSEQVIISVTVPTLSVSTNVLIHRYTKANNGSFVVEGGAPTVTCIASDTRAPVQWFPNVSNVDSAYQARLSPPGLEHTLSFPSIYESTPPNRTMYFYCTLLSIEASGATNTRVEVILRFIQSEIAILHDDMEISPNAVINYFPQPSLSLRCLGVKGHRSLTWETPGGRVVNQNDESSSSAYQTYVSGTQTLFFNLTSANEYYCRSQESDFSAAVFIEITDPIWRLISPPLIYLPVGGDFTLISVQYADNSTGYENFGAGFSYVASYSPKDKTQGEIVLDSGLTSNLTGNEYNYGTVTRIREQDGTYQINATHTDSGTQYSNSAEVRIIVPHFIQVDQVVVSRIGDLLTLRCVPNDSVATVTWLKGGIVNGTDVIKESSPSMSSFSPSDLRHHLTFNATHYALHNIGQSEDRLTAFAFNITCTFVNGVDTFDLLSPVNVTVLLQQERIKMSLGSSFMNNSISNNTIINSFTPMQRPLLSIDCTATQGDHSPNWIVPFDGSGENLTLQDVKNYIARLEMHNVSEISEGHYTCCSMLCRHQTRFFLTPTNPYLRAISPSSLDVIAGDVVTLEFVVAVNSDGVTWDRNSVAFTFSVDDSSEEQTLNDSFFQVHDSNYPHSFRYTIENVNRTHAGIYRATAARQDCSPEDRPCDKVSVSITMNVTTYCPEEVIGGFIWPQTISDTSLSQSCDNEATTFFEQRTVTTRYCNLDGFWSALDLSNCTVRNESSIFLLTWFVLENDTTTEGNFSSLLENEIRDLLVNDSVNFTRVGVSLSTFASTNGTAVTVELTLPSTTKVDEVSQLLEGYSERYSIREDNRGSTAVIPSPSCSCNSFLNTSIELCYGASRSPCNCTMPSQCQCQRPFVGDGNKCTLDSDGDNFPDIVLDTVTCRDPQMMSMKYCQQDNCPAISNPVQNDYDCQGQPPNDGCLREVDDLWGIEWPNVPKDTSSSPQPCPGGIATRFCDVNGQWGLVDVLQCTSPEFVELENLAGNLANLGEANDITQRLIQATEPQNRSLLPNDLGASSRILTAVIEVLENNNSTDEGVIEIFNNVLDDNNRVGWSILQSAGLMTSSELLLNNAERYALTAATSINMTENEEGSNVTQSRANIVVVGQRYQNPPKIDLRFPFSPDLINYTSSQNISTVTIPASLVRERLDKMGDNETLPVFFILLRNLPMSITFANTSTRSLTPCMGRDFTSNGASDVVSAQVGQRSNVSASLQESPVMLNFTFEGSTNGSLDSYTCVFWNFSDPIGNGTWDTAGVNTTNVTSQITNTGNTTTVRCSSNHLTSFAVLVDVAGELRTIREIEREALEAVSYLGCAVSIICLLITVYFFFRQSYKQRRQRMKPAQNFIHLNLALSLLLALIVFVLGVEIGTTSPGGCAFVAVVLHYLFLCAFCWMLCEGVLLYLLLRVVFSQMSKKWWPFILIGYVTPLPIVIITVIARHQYYGVKNVCGDLQYCWLSAEKGTIFGFVAPMLVIILINVTFMALALHAVWKSKKGQLKREHDSRVQTSEKLGRALFLATLVLLPLLGLTWVFGILTVNTNSTAFAWLFTIFNSLQGFFIFFFHVIRSDTVWGKISPKLNLLKNKVISATGSKEMSTGETAMHSKGKITGPGTSVDPCSTLGRPRPFKKIGGLSASMADSLNSPSNYELKSEHHPVSQAETDTKIELSTLSVEASLDDGLMEPNLISTKAHALSKAPQEDKQDETQPKAMESELGDQQAPDSPRTNGEVEESGNIIDIKVVCAGEEDRACLSGENVLCDNSIIVENRAVAAREIPQSRYDKEQSTMNQE